MFNPETTYEMTERVLARNVPTELTINPLALILLDGWGLNVPGATDEDALEMVRRRGL